MADTAVASAGAAVAVRAQPAVDQATAAILVQVDLRCERLVSRQAHEDFAAETRRARETDRAAREADRVAHNGFSAEIRAELKEIRTELKDMRAQMHAEFKEMRALLLQLSNK